MINTRKIYLPLYSQLLHVLFHFPSQIIYSLILLLMTQVLFDYVGYGGLFVIAGVIGTFGKELKKLTILLSFHKQILGFSMHLFF